jgi:hypothetical protein
MFHLYATLSFVHRNHTAGYELLVVTVTTNSISTDIYLSHAFYTLSISTETDHMYEYFICFDILSVVWGLRTNTRISDTPTKKTKLPPWSESASEPYVINNKLVGEVSANFCG